jgi:hypothetical protein
MIKKFNEAQTSKKRLVVKKGYTLTVVSWENDGDHYNTNTKIVETVEEAEAYYNLMQLCKSKNRGIGLGNSSNFSAAQKQLIIDFFKENPILLYDYFKQSNVEEFFKKNLEVEKGELDEEEYVEYFQDITCDLLGSSEYYACRVMESCTVTYSPEDIYLEEIQF